MRRYLTWELSRRSGISAHFKRTTHVYLAGITLFRENYLRKTYLLFTQIILVWLTESRCSGNLEVSYLFDRFTLLSLIFFWYLSSSAMLIKTFVGGWFFDIKALNILSSGHRCSWIKSSRFKHITRYKGKIIHRLNRLFRFRIPCDSKLTGYNLSIFRKHRYYTQTVFVLIPVHSLSSAWLYLQIGVWRLVDIHRAIVHNVLGVLLRLQQIALRALIAFLHTSFLLVSQNIKHRIYLARR